jgi:hypothetical protein
MKIKEDISTALKRNIKIFTQWLRFKEENNKITNNSASSHEADSEIS